MISDVFNMDCLEYMRNIPDKFFDLAIADPPYGIGRDGQKETKGKNPKHNRKFFENKGWDKHAPDEEFFAELFRISVNQVIFGANHFISKIPFDSPCWIVWDKGQKGLTMADCELAWTSYNRPARIFLLNRVALLKDGTIHPTQKPVSLYCWILKNYAIGGCKIFDPMMGSQSSRIAAYKMGFDFWGCELDEEYFKLGCERFEKECKGIVNVDGIMVEQKTLF